LGSWTSSWLHSHLERPRKGKKERKREESRKEKNQGKEEEAETKKSTEVFRRLFDVGVTSEKAWKRSSSLNSLIGWFGCTLRRGEFSVQIDSSFSVSKVFLPLMFHLVLGFVFFGLVIGFQGLFILCVRVFLFSLFLTFSFFCSGRDKMCRFVSSSTEDVMVR
jgi:hypothetical protein